MLLILGVVGFVAFIVGLVAVVSNNNALWLIPIFGGVLAMIAVVNMQSKSNVEKDIAKEVDLRQVSVSGQKNFRAQVQIIYKDGKLDSVVLMPKTTVFEMAAK
jgi:uncharacterized membrane protein YfcA